MKIFNHIQNKLSLVFAPVALLALASCGSYQYSGYEADGIYGESRPGIWEQEIPQNNEVKPNGNNSYYKNLFGQEADMYGQILEENVFTDVDSYSSNDGYDDYSEVGGDVAYVGGNAPWGEDPDNYTVNIYNNGFGGFYSPWNYGWGFGNRFNRFGYGGFGYGGFGYGGFGGFGYGFNDPFFFQPYLPYWGYGYGMNFGFGGGYWGSGWGYPYSGFGYGNNFYGNNFYGNSNRYAYHNTGRGNQVQNRTGRSERAYTNNVRSNTRSSYSRRIQEIRNSRGSSDYNSRTATAGRAATNSNSRGDMYTRTTRRSAPSTYEGYSRGDNSSRAYNPGTSRSSTTRSSSPAPTRSSTPTTRSSSSSSRSSGTISRGSSSSSRSSGSSSRGGGSSRGRG